MRSILEAAYSKIKDSVSIDPSIDLRGKKIKNRNQRTSRERKVGMKDWWWWRSGNELPIQALLFSLNDLTL